MRYEAKHSYFKRLAQSMGNFINLPYSLAMRHDQLLQCYNNTNDADMLGAGLTVGPGQLVTVFGPIACADLVWSVNRCMFPLHPNYVFFFYCIQAQLCLLSRLKNWMRIVPLSKLQISSVKQLTATSRTCMRTCNIMCSYTM